MSRRHDTVANYRNRLLSRICSQHPELTATIQNMKLQWYSIKNQEESIDPNQGNVPDEEAEVLIYDEIGGSLGVSAADFVQDLGAITAPKIKLRINSPGGSLYDSIAIYNALVQHPAQVTTYVDSLAASGASIVALAGDKVVMMPGSQMMIHDAIGMEMGNARDMDAMSTFLNRQSENIASIYANKAGGTEEDWRERMLAETWMFAKEAIELGLADEIYQSPKVAEGDEEEAPEEDEDDEEEIPPAPDEEEDDEEEPSEEAVNNFMRRKFDLATYNYKYSNRLAAPKPSNAVTAQNAHTMRELLRKAG